MTTAPKVALVTGATQGLGLALAEGLARRLDARDTVYLTGRDAGRVARAVDAMPGGGAQVRGEVFDVGSREAAGSRRISGNGMAASTSCSATPSCEWAPMTIRGRSSRSTPR